MVRNKDENGRKWSKTVLQYRKTKTVDSGYFYILVIKEYKKLLKMVVKPIEIDNFSC
jgi:hypothetical protein